MCASQNRTKLSFFHFSMNFIFLAQKYLFNLVQGISKSPVQWLGCEGYRSREPCFIDTCKTKAPQQRIKCSTLNNGKLGHPTKRTKSTARTKSAALPTTASTGVSSYSSVSLSLRCIQYVTKLGAELSLNHAPGLAPNVLLLLRVPASLFSSSVVGTTPSKERRYVRRGPGNTRTTFDSLLATWRARFHPSTACKITLLIPIPASRIH